MSIVMMLAGIASGAEVQFEGFYRARARIFDTLSLVPSTEDGSQGTSIFAQNRLWLRPRFVLTDEVALYTEFRGLDNVLWGSEMAPEPVFVDDLAMLEAQGYTQIFELSHGREALVDPARSAFSIWRAWGEVDTDIGRFTFGRVPLHWGMGIWLNDGLSTMPMLNDYGDTTDRVMWEQLFDQVFVRVAVDVPLEGLLGAQDDRTAATAAVAYRTEDLEAGILAQYEIQEGVGIDNGEPFGLGIFTADATVDLTLGPIRAQAEGLVHAGRTPEVAEQTNEDNRSLFAVGAAAEIGLDVDPFAISLSGGFASGDQPGRDQETRRFRGFAFDPDFSPGLFMFEQPLPTATFAPGAADPRTPAQIANAVFVKPQVSRRLAEGLTADASWLFGTTARPLDEDGTRVTYGNEFQIGAHYNGIQHLTVDGRLAVFVPGSVYTNQSLDDDGDTPFSRTAVGFQLGARIDF
ncbi:MAG: hypothetical protein AAF211_19510 [Myxococcota bacterium]